MSSERNILKRLLEANTSIDYMKASDEELVDLVQKKKDKRAEETLIKRYNNLVAHVGKNYFMKSGDADDIQQEGLLGLVDAIKTYVPGRNKNFKQFAMLAVKRNITDAVRSSSRKKHSFVSDAGDIDSPEIQVAAGSKSDPFFRVVDKESKKRVQDYMKKNLTTHEMSVLAQYLRGLTYNEIADNLGITRKSVDNAMNSVRSKMRKYKASIKDSKIIDLLESILNGENREYLRETYKYLFR